MTKRQFKIDFFCVTASGKRKHPLLSDMLAAVPSAGCTAAMSLENGDEKYQLRSIVPLPGGTTLKAIFGRCRYNEVLTQGDEHGAEADVTLKPGHGLVEKNHLLFIPAQNLLVYQRNSNGSHHSKLQAYLNRLMPDGRFVLEPILQRDAYEKLIKGGEVKRFEVSFLAPSDPSLYKDLLTSDATRMLKACGATSGHIKMSVGRRPQGLQAWIKDSIASMAQAGLATVARVKLDDIEHPIDLIADRLLRTVEVEVGLDGRVLPDAYFSALANAKYEATDTLNTFFGT